MRKGALFYIFADLYTWLLLYLIRYDITYHVASGKPHGTLTERW